VVVAVAALLGVCLDLPRGVRPRGLANAAGGRPRRRPDGAADGRLLPAPGRGQRAAGRGRPARPAVPGRGAAFGGVLLRHDARVRPRALGGPGPPGPAGFAGLSARPAGAVAAGRVVEVTHGTRSPRRAGPAH